VNSPIFSAATTKNNKKALNCVFAILQIFCFHVSSPGFSAIYRFSTNNTCVMLVCSYNSLAHSKELFQKLSLDCGHEKSKAVSLCWRVRCWLVSLFWTASRRLTLQARQ